MIPPPLLDVIAFCALGAMNQTQQFAHMVIDAMPGADREKAFAETLCMVSVASARAAASALPAEAVRTHLTEVLSGMPLTLHSYAAGFEMLSGEQASETDFTHETGRLERMLAFYEAQMGDGGYPDQKTLRHAMILWMGRISPSGLEEHPEKRLERLELVERMSTYVRLVEAFTRNAANEE